jgi:Flp pilus assembly pilin Flp
MRSFLRDEAGVSAVEYGAVLACICLAALVTFNLVGDQVRAAFQALLAALALLT